MEQTKWTFWPTQYFYQNEFSQWSCERFLPLPHTHFTENRETKPWPGGMTCLRHKESEARIKPVWKPRSAFRQHMLSGNIGTVPLNTWCLAQLQAHYVSLEGFWSSQHCLWQSFFGNVKVGERRAAAAIHKCIQHRQLQGLRGSGVAYRYASWL